MRWRRGLGRRVRGLVLAGLLTLCGALAGVPAHSFEPPPGGKNFTAPGSVPNYFSNEAALFGRGSRVAQPGADRFNTAPIAVRSRYAAMPAPTRGTVASAGPGPHRGRLARGKAGGFNSAAPRAGRTHLRKAHGRPAHPQKARGRSAMVRLSAHAAARKSVATWRRAAATRSRHAARQARRAYR